MIVKYARLIMFLIHFQSLIKYSTTWFSCLGDFNHVQSSICTPRIFDFCPTCFRKIQYDTAILVVALVRL